MNLIERMEATQKTVDTMKLRPFAWGKTDCVQLALKHARHCGAKIKSPDVYKDALSAKRALKKRGHKSLSEMMDRYFKRIKPHERLLGDFIEMPGEGTGFSSLAVDVGNGRALGFHADIPHCDIIQPVMVSGAWRVE